MAAFLIILSAALHGFWNFIFKRAGGDEAIIAASKIVEIAVLLPVAAFLLMRSPVAFAGLALLAVVGAALVLANYRLLAAAYRRVDLSVAYPIARGSVLFFLPLFGFLAFQERLSLSGILGLLLITAGVLMQTKISERVSWGGVLFAVAAAMSTAGYAVWDKHAVLNVHPIVYYTSYTILLTIAYAIIVKPVRMIEAGKTHPAASVAIAAGNTGSYLLVLFALQTSISSYVIGLRQLSILLGVFLGWRFLNERVSAFRLAGVMLLLAGCALVALTGL